ncbi:hypothetical protein V7O66_09110 [Methanolobus sp. ZRKC3]|uniref:hypothetical protein n=1 Tax=Methanolobus sp. ZRKC3 TaxID=3125786 RepID=UPI00324EBC08
MLSSSILSSSAEPFSGFASVLPALLFSAFFPSTLAGASLEGAFLEGVFLEEVFLEGAFSGLTDFL